MWEADTRAHAPLDLVMVVVTALVRMAMGWTHENVVVAAGEAIEESLQPERCHNLVAPDHLEKADKQTLSKHPRIPPNLCRHASQLLSMQLTNPRPREVEQICPSKATFVEAAPARAQPSLLVCL